ncbi:MAG: helix-turn-helix transcriptional regulator [Synechococcaceae cyanobacterium]|nr:helix-turn-helix transcriptional regulator [Synechococcaceae cyanobacterium]
MNDPGPSPLSPPSLRAAAGRLLGALRRSGPRPAQSAAAADASPADPLLLAGRTLREAREARGLGLRQLAQETRISTPVLEALERGWADRLPEPAYLRTMLPLLEEHLGMAAGTLQGALPRRLPQRPGAQGGSLLRRFTPGSIDVFTTWQGTLLYALLTLAAIHALNLQQRRLAALGRLTVAPLPITPRPGDADSAAAEARLLQAHPDLRPLQVAGRGQALQRLRREARQDRPDLSLGVLTLRLARPTRLELRSAAGDAGRLEEARGELALPVLPPFRLRLDPPPAAGDAVLWRGRPLVPGPTPKAPADGGEESEDGSAAEYRYPPPSPGPRP